MTERWKDGDVAVLRHGNDAPILVRLTPGPQPLGRDGVIDLSAQIGRPPGGTVDWLGVPHRLLRPALADLFATLRRGAQIVTPKDAAYLLYLGGVGPGSSVAEAGSGSGALTIALAHAVGPSGRVASYDRRPESLATAKANVERAGLLARVTFYERDVGREGFDAVPVSSVLLDLPEPWEALPRTVDVLEVGGFVVAFVPTYNQLERTVRTLRAGRFSDVRAVELLERALHVGDGGTRPEFDMLGHTGFLASGRRVE